jgi:hypothetical protein
VVFRKSLAESVFSSRRPMSASELNAAFETDASGYWGRWVAGLERSNASDARG